MNKEKKASAEIRDILTVLFSTNNIYTSTGESFQGECPRCGFDHSQKSITRYNHLHGYCKFLGIFETEVECAESKCSNPECGVKITWYARRNSSAHFMATTC